MDEGRQEGSGRRLDFSYLHLLVMMRMGFHKVVSVKVYGVEYGICIVFPRFAGVSPLIRASNH